MSQRVEIGARTAVTCIALLLGGVSGCERKPFFRDPPKFTGGVTLQCIGVTDFLQRAGTPNGDPCPLYDPTGELEDIVRMDQPQHACNCLTPGETTWPTESLATPLPPMTPDGNASGPIAFIDPLCTSTLASACIPKVIPTTTAWDDPGGLPAGQLWVQRLVDRAVDANHPRDWPSRYNIIDVEFRPEDAALSGSDTAESDLNALTFQACHLAHFGAIAFVFLPAGARYHTPEWIEMVTVLQNRYGQYTSIIDSQDMLFWKGLAPDNGGNESYLGSKMFGPFATTCKEGAVYPFGYGAVGIFELPPMVANTPPPDSIERRTSCPGGDCDLEPLSYYLLVDRPASIAMVSVTGDGVDEEATVGIGGNFNIEAQDCSRADDSTVSCEALVTGSTLSVDAFEILGEEVALLRVQSGLTPSRAVITDQTIFIPEFEGTAEARLSDGSLDFIKVETGALLGHWNPATNTFMAAFTFEVDIDDNITAVIQGTLGGHFENVSPIAIANATYADGPASQDPASSDGVFECQSPAGTSLALTSEHSLDAEGDPLRTQWLSLTGDSRDVVSSEARFETEPLDLGGHAFLLRVFDHRGTVGEDALELRIEDRAPPTFDRVDAPACLWPPNRRLAHLRLGHEITFDVSDQCTGDRSGTVRIVSATSNEPSDGVPDIVMTPEGICLRAERSGAGSGRTYEITLAADDGNGNESTEKVVVSVPKSSGGSCLRSVGPSHPCAAVPLSMGVGP